MPYIVPKFESLEHYLISIAEKGPKEMSPKRCPHCGKSRPWLHGHYLRKADRENPGKDSLNPVPIFRFFCNHCKRTCSALPECIPPRRWYLWAVQQVVLLLIIVNHSWRYIALKTPPGRSTVKRWGARFNFMFALHTFHVRSRFPELGRSGDSFSIFWKECLQQMSLAETMCWVHGAGCIVP